MSDDSLSSVIITASYQDGEPSETHHEGVDLLAVRGDELHVWFEGTHYIGKGTASAVNEGDLFFRTAPETQINKVVSIEKSKPPSARGVKVKILYGPLLDSGEILEDETSVNELIGELENPPMGDLGPPTLLKED